MKRLAVLILTLIPMLGLAGCMANPGPPPVVEDPPPAPEQTTTTTTEPPAERSRVAVGVTPLRNGLNPHLRADNNATVESIADLVLPSAFINGQLNEDLLVSAEESVTPQGQQRVVYEISPEAQWSDGTPITGKDFAYLHSGMVNTPDVVNDAPYRTIERVTSSAGGRIVTVIFEEYLADWSTLFNYLLPSHLVEPNASDFASAFYSDIPASAGRFLVESVDRARGVVTLHRNDRFWGENPAQLDILQLNGSTSVTQSADQIRSGQFAFLDVIPQETSLTAYQLLPEAQTAVINGPRELVIELNTQSEALADLEARAEFFSLVDRQTVAYLAAGRSSDVVIPEFTMPEAREPELLSSVTIGADPADPQASAAARAVVDIFAGYNVEVTITAEDEADAYIASRRLSSPSSDLLCPTTHVGSQRHGYCTEQAHAYGLAVLAGEVSEEEARMRVDAMNVREFLWIPLLTETRVQVLGQGIVEPEDWQAGISSAATWELDED